MTPQWRIEQKRRATLVADNDWHSIDTAPKDGSHIRGRAYVTNVLNGRRRAVERRTFWGKTSHIPLYGWNYGRDVENLNLWEPTQWRPLKGSRA